MKTTNIILIIILLICAPAAYAQHDMDKMRAGNHSSEANDANDSDDDDMDSMDMRDDVKHGMTSGLSRHLPMPRDGSGTSWQPDVSTMYSYMVHPGKWMFMFSGDLFVRYNRQDITNAGSRGGEKWDAPDMLMVMVQRSIGRKGLFRINTMFSADALITGGEGYPLLFQTGETWQGKPLVDRQHPHDLIAELSASYAYSFSKKSDLYLYLGYPGEPALGPGAFMHRPSGRFIPDAPISHHWADATHITFGVATLGIRHGKFKLEASSFTGREPNEDRYDLDPILFDSWSGRLSFNPSGNWALQVSRGHIKSPEALHPNENIDRTTASATYVYNIDIGKYFTGTALWGQNQIAGTDPSNSALAEITLKLNKLDLYSRYEWVQKTGEELNLAPAMYNLNAIYPANVVTIGGGYDLFKIGHIVFNAGAQASVYNTSSTLSSLYGTYPISGEVYLHIYPGRIN
ncbi:MAG: hypothetical protein JWQ38_2841 [Flavipsychrobacter sp.]|nr:hypothetical protein [Flavipsychrobacter sp.]